MSHPRRATPSTVETVIVGAGPAGLAVALQMAARLPGSTTPDRLRVVDPTGGWLTVWHHQMAAQRIAHLRSPAVHHPGIQPFQLVHACDQERDLVKPDRIHLPTTTAFAAFCREQIVGHGLHLVVQQDQVVRLRPTGDRRVRVDLERDALIADRVVVACNPRRRMWPSWAADPQLRRRGLLLHGGGLQRRDTDGRPLHRGRRVVVVGGGLSAAQLARGAVEDGAHVTVLARRPIVRRRMDVDPRWLGPTLMGPFAAAAPARRRRMLDDARGGGSMPVWAERELRHLHRGGRLNLREGVGVDLLVPVDDGVAVCTRDGVAVADQIWLATGSIPDVGADPALADLAARCPVALHDGLPELRADLGWATTAVHVAGALAGLQVGPIAGNLAGHRQAAERIVAAWA